jgi:hypothetical protein
MLGSVDSRDRARRGALTAVLATGGLAVHLAVQRLAPAPIAHTGAGLVGLVPFLPWTVWVYLLFFPLLVAAGVLVEASRWARLVLAWAMASVTAWLLVVMVPVTFPRPDPTSLGPLDGWVFGLVHGVDSAHLTFPCLHSAVIWIAWLALRDRAAPLRIGGFVVAAAITLSTMTTRQHLVTDNVAGLAIAWVCARLAAPSPAPKTSDPGRAAQHVPAPSSAPESSDQRS